MLAFCIPLSFVVRSLAYDRAIDTAEVEARTLAAELATAHDAAAIVKLARQANSAAGNTASVYLASGHTASGLSHLVYGPGKPLPPSRPVVAGWCGSLSAGTAPPGRSWSGCPPASSPGG